MSGHDGATDVAGVLADPVTRTLLDDVELARLAYNALDGTPRVTEGGPPPD